MSERSGGEIETRLRELRREVAIGVEQAMRGELVDGDAVFDELRRKSQARREMYIDRDPSR